MKSVWRREGRGWGRHGYYWSFFSDSVASSLVSSDDSSYLKKKKRTMLVFHEYESNAAVPLMASGGSNTPIQTVWILANFHLKTTER